MYFFSFLSILDILSLVDINCTYIWFIYFDVCYFIYLSMCESWVVSPLSRPLSQGKFHQSQSLAIDGSLLQLILITLYLAMDP